MKAFRVRLSFWGARCDVLVPTRADAEHLALYFQGHGADDSPPLHTFWFDSNAHGFVEALLNPAIEKRIWRHSGDGEWTLWDRFKCGSNAPSPLPPLSLEPLAGRIASLHAAAVVHPQGRAYLLVGPSFSGKSVLSIGLLDHDWRLLSDDIAVIDLRSRRVLAFRRPVGVRANTLALLPGLGARLDAAPDYVRVELADSETYMVRPEHLECTPPPDSAELAGIVLLEPSARVRAPTLVRTGNEDLARGLSAAALVHQVPAWLSDFPGRLLSYDIETQAVAALARLVQELDP